MIYGMRKKSCGERNFFGRGCLGVSPGRGFFWWLRCGDFGGMVMVGVVLRRLKVGWWWKGLRCGDLRWDGGGFG